MRRGRLGFSLIAAIGLRGSGYDRARSVSDIFVGNFIYGFCTIIFDVGE